MSTVSDYPLLAGIDTEIGWEMLNPTACEGSLEEGSAPQKFQPPALNGYEGTAGGGGVCALGLGLVIVLQFSCPFGWIAVALGLTLLLGAAVAWGVRAIQANRQQLDPLDSDL